MAAIRAAAALILIAVVVTGVRANLETKRTSERMAAAGKNFLSALTDEQKAKAKFAFEADERFDWHYIPKANRKGMPFKEMSGDQIHLAHALLSASLSADGHDKAATIMSLEPIVKQMEQQGQRTPMFSLRDPMLYFITIFGDPAPDKNWGWSIEGHHISLNFTCVNGKTVMTTPFFFGAQPHVGVEGPRAGLRPLGEEEDKARALLGSLDDRQRKSAIIGEEAPSDIYTRAERKAEIAGPPRGLRAGDMSAKQKEMLWSLIEEYVTNLPADVAQERWERAREGNQDEIYFVWMGSTEQGVGHPHYYRVQGPKFLIEYDNIQHNANHSHSVWRDYDRDFGLDLLAQHHAQDHQP